MTDIKLPEPKPCNHCNGTGWVDDMNWAPRYDDIPQEREPGDGQIRCGICLGDGSAEPDYIGRISELEADAAHLADLLEQMMDNRGYWVLDPEGAADSNEEGKRRTALAQTLIAKHRQKPEDASS